MAETSVNENHKVLIVDDEDLTRVLLSRVLERVKIQNIDILLAEDGEEALRIAAAERPDLVLLDLLLPKLNGYDVCRELRMIPGYEPHIIILTARGQDTDREHAREIGADGFMTKPFNPSRLIAQLNELWHISDSK
jgi:two-component system, OmpR family, alkaline phosphatase synthesis response regulator PhoP